MLRNYTLSQKINSTEGSRRKRHSKWMDLSDFETWKRRTRLVHYSAVAKKWKKWKKIALSFTHSNTHIGEHENNRNLCCRTSHHISQGRWKKEIILQFKGQGFLFAFQEIPCVSGVIVEFPNSMSSLYCVKPFWTPSPIHLKSMN